MTDAFAAFWTQRSSRHRNAQILYASLAGAFLCSGFSYCFMPQQCGAFFGWMDRLLGGAEAPIGEPQQRIWTSLAGANVATLSLMSWGLWRDFAKNRAMHRPLLFMKSVSAMLFLYWFAFDTERPSLLVAFVSDAVTAVIIHIIGSAAIRELDEQPDLPRVRLFG